MNFSQLIVFAFAFIGSLTPYLHADKNLSQILKDFDQYAEQQRQAWQIPGMAIGIVKDQDVILIKGYGQRGIQDTRPVDETTLFQIGSLSKAFTAALVAISVDKGRLKWEDNVINHMTTFRLSDPWVTNEFQIIDLLAQRSGLPPYAGDSQSFLGFSSKDMLEHLRFLKPVSSFRSQYAYQNIFFLVAAHILEQKAKMNYQTLWQKELFTPLAMTDTNASLQDYLANDNRVEWFIRLKNGSISHLPDDFPYRDWNYILGPAGGINSNANDMTKWLMLQANQGKFQGKQLISASNMQRMTRPMIYANEVDGHAMYYGLGWVHMDYSPYPIIWHDGGTLGVYNVAAFIPQEKLGIIILTNVRNTQLAFALAFQFFDMYFNKQDQNWSQQLLMKAKDQQTASDEIESPYPPMDLSNYAGTYTNPIYGEAQVSVEGDQLILHIGKNHQRLEMKPWDRDIFVFQWPLVTDSDSKVVFIPGDDGQIAKMNIDIFAKEGAGEFEKQSKALLDKQN